MPATIIDGRAVAARVREDVAREVSEFVAAGEDPPGLATVLVGDDPGSAVYVANKRRASAEVGIADFHRHLAAEASQAEVAGVPRGAQRRKPAVSEFCSSSTARAWTERR